MKNKEEAVSVSSSFFNPYQWLSNMEDSGKAGCVEKNDEKCTRFPE